MRISEMKRTARANYSAYLNSNDYSLDTAYGRYSTAKYRAWLYCRDACNAANGFNLKVVNHNSFVFTAGFESINAETGVIEFTYITPNYDITIDSPCID